ncbi:hypothetical protein [Brevundimonas sp. GCM10030266]|uniref:hypothetical protein n=1 Tax=Brevundimonas sp. GCM10030266 TaxID=3273386 RepID=UPI0036065ADD
MKALRLATAALGLTLLSGCVTDPGYSPMDASKNKFYGYTDALNGAGGYTIRVALPEGVQDPRSAFAHWERRAAELCGPAGYRKQVHTARRNMLMMPGYSPTGFSYEVIGDAYCTDPSVLRTEPAAPVEAPVEAAAPAAN